MWAEAARYDDEKFKRHSSVSKDVFLEMVRVMEERERKKNRSGRPPAFCIDLQYKKKKNQKLSKQQETENRALAKVRILAENVIRRLKIFRILKHDYRNRRRRFSLRVNLISAIHNLELEKKS